MVFPWLPKSTHFVPTGGLITYKKFLLLCSFGFCSFRHVSHAMTKAWQRWLCLSLAFSFCIWSVLTWEDYVNLRADCHGSFSVAWQGRLLVRPPKKELAGFSVEHLWLAASPLWKSTHSHSHTHTLGRWGWSQKPGRLEVDGDCGLCSNTSPLGREVGGMFKWAGTWVNLWLIHVW